jgi:dTDP-4-amino-4,6-dideoxy-D-galactose acyltransferase
MADLDPRLERAAFYSPLRFLRQKGATLAEEVIAEIAALEQDGSLERIGGAARIRLSYLDWDSQFFGFPIYSLRFPDWDDDLDDPIGALARTIETVRAMVRERDPRSYLFAEIPSEDLVTLQALGWARARLIETRVVYFRDDIARYESRRRYPVRHAVEADIPNLRDVSANAINPFDRFHADPAFSPDIAARFLATFAENSVRGFADIVMVPDDPAPAGAFITAKLLPRLGSSSGVTAGKIILAASSKERTGWSYKITSELGHWFKDRGVGVVFFTTQTTNLRLTRFVDALGYKYGGASHVFSVAGP